MKDFYNKNFLVKARDFISNYKLEEGPSATPIRTTKKNILQKMNMDSPLRQNIHTLSKKSDIKVGTYLKKADMKIPNSFSMTTPPMTPNYRELYAQESPYLSKRPPLQKK